MLFDTGLANSALTWLGAAGAAALGWFITHWYGKPILEIRQKRLDALRLAELHAFAGGYDDKQQDEKARLALEDIAASLRVDARSLPWLVRAYCRFCRYDLELAAHGLFSLSNMIGNWTYKSVLRRETLNIICLALNAHQHLTVAELSAVNDVLTEYRKTRRKASAA